MTPTLYSIDLGLLEKVLNGTDVRVKVIGENFDIERPLANANRMRFGDFWSLKYTLIEEKAPADGITPML